MTPPEVPRRPLPGKLQIPLQKALFRSPLATDRLIIEPITSRIARRLYTAVDESRDALLPWLPWVPFNDSPKASERYAEACEGDWEAGAALRFCLRLRDKPEVVGAVTLENCVHLHRGCDLGYWLHTGSTGQGLMTEAAGRVVQFAFEDVGFHRIRCAAGVDNTPSRRVIERLGFSFEGTARDAEKVAGRWITHAVYAKLATDVDAPADGAEQKQAAGQKQAAEQKQTAPGKTSKDEG